MPTPMTPLNNLNIKPGGAGKDSGRYSFSFRSIYSYAYIVTIMAASIR